MRFCFAVPRTSSYRRKEKQSRRNSKAAAWPEEGQAQCQSRAAAEQPRAEPQEEVKRPATPARSYRTNYRWSQRCKVAPEPNCGLAGDKFSSRFFDNAYMDCNKHGSCPEDRHSRAKLRAAAAAAAFTVLCGDDMPIPPSKVDTPLPPLEPHPWQKLGFNIAAGYRDADIRHPEESKPVGQGLSGGASGSQSAASNGLRFSTSLEQAFDVLSSASLANLSLELTLAKKMPLSQRRKLFLSLCRHWHPDKNSGNEMQAKAMFQSLQNHKEWFLAAS